MIITVLTSHIHYKKIIGIVLCSSESTKAIRLIQLGLTPEADGSFAISNAVAQPNHYIELEAIANALYVYLVIVLNID